MKMNEINLAVWWVLSYEDGKTESLGGLERWTRELVFELIRRGVKVNIYQKSKEYFSSDFYGASIIGIPSKKSFIGNIQFYKKLTRIADKNLPTIFISQDLVAGNAFPRSIAINHGVWWAAKHGFVKRRIIEVFNRRYLENTSKTICVDTNYINWVIENVTNSNELIEKLNYIPNFYDKNEFKFKPRQLSSEPIQILFPRRIMGDSIDYEPRGGSDAILALKLARDAGVDCRLKILGQGNLAPQLLQYAKDIKVDKFISFSCSSFDEMERNYHDSDIVLVPSRFSEGTSLSAIEALATGRYVIGSCIGGLQNIPLHYPFGDMVTPEANSIAHAIINYHLNKHSLDVDELTVENAMIGFEKNTWIKKVFDIIEQI
ncbi:glycosyltransferase family 4 protein [Aeromonas veronii]|uniref:glycosyltransferase family 4 protein n=1 Tax=Aeromonas veronii TaxID=654 RepID=UPI001FD6BB78|nr:glycosyltransferase family 4 protein [Aeromonas veronii]MCJ8217238.1 glycosyltransferase family 4 protein [Aeromonas veronii]WOE83560.1 glycosyltransferase family 4 protein [Aeromonas veronii]